MTLAQRAARAFREQLITTSMSVCARRLHGVKRQPSADEQITLGAALIVYDFTDASRLITKGRGRNLKVWTL